MARSNPATRHRRSGNKWQLLQPGVWVLQQPEADGGTIGVLRDGKHYIAVRANGARFRGLRSLAGAKAVAGGASGEGLVDRQYLAALNEAKINPARHRGGLLSHYRRDRTWEEKAPGVWKTKTGAMIVQQMNGRFNVQDEEGNVTQSLLDFTGAKRVAFGQPYIVAHTRRER